jgi:hypothetical protein
MLCLICWLNGETRWVLDPAYHLHANGHIPEIAADHIADALLSGTLTITRIAPRIERKEKRNEPYQNPVQTSRPPRDTQAMRRLPPPQTPATHHNPNITGDGEEGTAYGTVPQERHLT